MFCLSSLQSLFCSISFSHFVSLSFSLLLPLHFQRFIKRHLKFKYGHKCRCVQLCRNAGNAKTNDSPSDPPIVNSSGQALTPWHRRKYNNKNSNRDNNNDNNSAQTYSKKMFGSENYKPLEHILQVPALGRRSGHTRPAQKQEQEGSTEYFPHMDGEFFVLFAVVVFFANHFSWAAEKVETEMRAYTTDMRDEVERKGDEVSTYRWDIFTRI